MPRRIAKTILRKHSPCFFACVEFVYCFKVAVTFSLYVNHIFLTRVCIRNSRGKRQSGIEQFASN